MSELLVYVYGMIQDIPSAVRPDSLEMRGSVGPWREWCFGPGRLFSLSSTAVNSYATRVWTA